MSHTPANQTMTNGNHTQETNFPPLPPGCEFVREVTRLCNYCGQEYFEEIYISSSRLLLSRGTPCGCTKHTRNTPAVQNIDITNDLDRLFRPWNLLHTDHKEYNINLSDPEGPEQEKIKNSVIIYLRQFKPGSKGICFSGKSGRGKTHIAMCIAHGVQQKNYSVLAIKSIDLLNRLRKCYQSKESDQELQVMRVLKNVDLLFIDDIGTEKITGWVEEKLYEVIDTRYERLTTIFTTNLSGQEMTDKLGQALASRIFGGYQVNVPGKDRRLTNAALDFSEIGKER